MGFWLMDREKNPKGISKIPGGQTIQHRTIEILHYKIEILHDKLEILHDKLELKSCSDLFSKINYHV